MNILVVGPYKEDRFTQEVILSLNEVNPNTICRSFDITPNLKTIHPKIIELENKSFSGKCDVLVQCVSPHFMEYHKVGGLNVGMLNLPTMYYPLNLAQKISFMDKTIEISEIPVACNISGYKQFSKLTELEKLNKNKFVFYSIGDYTKKSGFTSIIRAYLTEFKFWENVTLVIKAKSKLASPKEVINKFLSDIEMTKMGLGLEQCPGITIIGDSPENPDDNVHATCDCYVGADHGLDWDFYGFDAMCFGKTPILPKNRNGFHHFLKYGYLYNSDYTQVFASQDQQYQDLYSSSQKWLEPNIEDIETVMRKAFNNENRENLSKLGIKAKDNFSYAKVGSLLLKALQDEKESNRNKRLG